MAEKRRKKMKWFGANWLAHMIAALAQLLEAAFGNLRAAARFR